MILFSDPLEFEWDKGNKDKNQVKHGICAQECEEVFFDPDKKILKDILHSDNEDRYLLIGQTAAKKVLFIVFTIRRQKVRIISARVTNKRERGLYEERN